MIIDFDSFDLQESYEEHLKEEKQFLMEEEYKKEETKKNADG